MPLLSAALTGLAKFTHLISIDFLGDLMELFRKLLAKEDLLSDALKAQTLLTACEILSGHGEVLQVDTGEFSSAVRHARETERRERRLARGHVHHRSTLAQSRHASRASDSEIHRWV